MRLLLMVVILNVQCSMFHVYAQIKIGGNVYGGGNEGNVMGSTKVTVLEGDIGTRPADSDEPLANPLGKVFGGARMAKVGGNSYVNIDGANASGYIVINQVYGGNDISGTIGTAAAVGEGLPEELQTNADHTNKHGVDNTWNAYVHISTKMKEEEGKTVPDETQKTYIGQVFAGGNGDYDYVPVGEPVTIVIEDETVTKQTYDVYLLPRTENDKAIATITVKKDNYKPELDKTYLDVQGGSIVYAYGGGSNATVEEKAVIHVDNPSKVVNHIFVNETTGVEGNASIYAAYEDSETDGNPTIPTDYIDLLTTARFKDMGINTSFAKPSSDEFQIGSFYGGNNKADMAIRPTWHLQDGKIRNLYSGGNRGRMIHEQGIFLEIPESSTLVVDNLFGGCRMADVCPISKTTGQPVKRVTGKLDEYEYAFPNNLAARVIVAGGDVNNVYGGNDVRGKVYFGSAVGIQTSIRGNVYGGGNGAYPYTDNTEVLQNDPLYGDFCYDSGGNNTIEVLNTVRPNAEQVSIQVRGKDAAHPTIIKGSIYVGGNCATLKADPDHAGLDMGTSKTYPLTELKIGSHVIAENVFLGNNGEDMVDEEILKLYANIDPETGGHFGFTTMDLIEDQQFSKYMQGVALSQVPSLIVEDKNKGDRVSYEPYTSYIGSLYYGSNRGSMTYSGPIDISPDAPIYIYNKLVAGCNNANIAETDYNAAYEGGILGDDEEQNGYVDANGKIKDRVLMNITKIKLKPMRLNSEGNGLEWNTVKWADSYIAVADGTTLTAGDIYYTSDTGEGKFISEGTETADATHQYYTKTSGYIKTETGSGTGAASDADLARRLLGGNIYGGCCESGHVNGNVVINLNGSLVDRHEIFDAFTGEEDGDDILYERPKGGYNITERRSGVILNEQGMDVLGSALNVFGGGKGAGTEIWGSATVNILKGYTFQVFGGSENGVIGKSREGTYAAPQAGDYVFNGRHYPAKSEPAYSTYVNLNGLNPGQKRGPSSPATMAEAEFIYGGGFSGPILGSTNVHLDNGRLFNLFAGSCNADILGHTETYVGLNGIPYLRDHIYGGNDLGGQIKGVKDYTDRVRPETLPLVHPTDLDDGTGKGTLTESRSDQILDVLQANTYIEYRNGTMKEIYGGCFGDYDYIEEFKAEDGYSIPLLHGSFVNFRPDEPKPSGENSNNHVDKVFGAGEGMPGIRDGDRMQDRSYVLVDIPDGVDNFASTEVFGGGSNNGLGLIYSKDETLNPSFNIDNISAIVDLAHGQISAAYGGAYNEGITLRSVVNVPIGSTINIGNIFGGAYGINALPPCDVYESNVNYHSEDAIVRDAIFGGNNNVRRTLYSKVNIFCPVYNGGIDKNTGAKYTASVYGAGLGESTWSEYTEVNLEPGAKVYEVYGGGKLGQVLNAESIQKYMQAYINPSSVSELPDHIENAFDPADLPKWKTLWKEAWTIGNYYIPNEAFDNYVTNNITNLSNDKLATRAEIDDRSVKTYKYNTNVRIKAGAEVQGYAYGGGLGDVNKPSSGDVIGTTYIALLGGTVVKDIYAAGTTGNVYNIYGGDFTASANAYIKGGTARNVYGGGWKGSVGAHTGDITAAPTDDVPAETHVVIGDLSGSSFTDGIPAVQRNAYGGGEGGAVYGSAYLTLYNGYVGYDYKNGAYQEKEEDDTKETPNKLLKDAGCLFGGGYVDNSSVDKTFVKVYGGNVRNSAFGGGEIAAIGRGTVSKTTNGEKTEYTLTGLYRPGKTNIQMFGGHVHRNVYGGGRGYDNLDRHGLLNCDGFVFGQTEVHIHGGEIGTRIGVANNDGNVFGGGDVGFVYSAYENVDGTFGKGVKDGERYKNVYQGYYYQHDWNGTAFVTEVVDTDGEGNDITERKFTEDCKVLVEPQCKVTGSSSVEFTGIRYKKGETVTSRDLEYIKQNRTDLLDKLDAQGKVTRAAYITFDRSYDPGSYVSIAALNTLKDKSSDERWASLDGTGIIIHNAVFAGGNTSIGAGSNSNVNATTVFGNATASIHDVYNRDLITLGTRHTGGLYGDGNLTFVDGYRELNITNYGTDYYSIQDEIGIDAYHELPEREAAYYELKYKCKQDCEDKDGTQYKAATQEGGKASTITADDYFTVFKDWKYNGVDMIVPDPQDNTKQIPNPDYWEENGVLPVYAGRLMNSIQRADFCGVWGSRMVMQGAQDRVPEKPNFINYTINRVREVSLNKVTSSAGDTDAKNKEHGNYFGIYNIVNYLGALTSDVKFTDVRHTEALDEGTYKCEAGMNGPAYGTATYYDWKSAFHDVRKRNNASSHNKVALASGVYLELTSEEGEGAGSGLYDKVWGPITGIVELDLINVQPGIGGGFVYAQNVHGVPTLSGRKNTTLTALNTNAVTKWDYEYTTDDASKVEWQTSGNFVHSSQTIIDDCYNISGKYKTNYKAPDGVPAHYWFIKGEVYVYDQYISAYTGIPNAYSETVEIPLTITAASHGTMKLLNVQPNYYAYYASSGVKLVDDQKLVINDKTYYKNDPISFWDYYMLTSSEKELFVPKTYVNCIACNIDGKDYAAGTYVMTDNEFTVFRENTHSYKDDEGNVILDGDKNVADADYIFRESNNMSHDKGYILTYKVNNPGVWDTWYTQKTGASDAKIDLAAYDVLTKAQKDDYEDGPTYHLINNNTGSVLGQREYKVGDIISQKTETAYQDLGEHKPNTDDQAKFKPAHLVVQQITIQEQSGTRHLNPGNTVSEAVEGYTKPAYICTNTIELSKTEFIYVDTKMTLEEKNAYLARFSGDTDAEKKKKKEIDDNIVPAYYCWKAGLYGGNYYAGGRNYRGLEVWSSMSETDRNKFAFNYDAFDVLIDPTYSHLSTALVPNKYQYDSSDATKEAAEGNPAGYSLSKPLDYTAEYYSDTDLSVGKSISVKREGSTVSTETVKKGDELVRDVYESLTNEQRHYSVINVKGGKKEGNTYKVYVVNQPFQIGNTPYAIGTVIDAQIYNGLTDKSSITELTFPDPGEGEEGQTYYYCRESYKVGYNGNGVPVTNVNGTEGFDEHGNRVTIKTNAYTDAPEDVKVPIGVVVGTSTYSQLTANNKQQNFTIHGISPTELSTLYVSNESDIYDLSKEKIITVVYQYDYDEVQTSGAVTPITERHVVNIHVNFKSGVPIVDDIDKPEIVLPGDYITMIEPEATPGAYQITGGGWELFENKPDAESHKNGIDFDPDTKPLYWYQHDWYLAYYAKTYLGRTYSNYVPVSVANYHDLKKVMEATEHHYYVDEANVKRDPKIYINDYSQDETGSKNGLDLLKSLFDLSYGKSDAVTTYGAFENPSNITGGNNLEFILRTNLNRSDDPDTPDEWTSIANGTNECFEGTLHGDGYTISGLDNSLFGHLCGNVYNLGVTGSFTGAGIAETGSGYLENCWVKTSSTAEKTSKPVFGNPTGFAATNEPRPLRIVNCYYDEEDDAVKKYENHTGTYGIPTRKPDKSFNNGEVAYDLNGFYLYKRYNDNASPSPGGTATYKYWTPGESEPQSGTYADCITGDGIALCSSGYNNIKYVEDRFADGDFRYAAGIIPENEDERYYLETTVTNSSTNEVTKTPRYYPIWPDDYLFFGQTLTYGYVDGRPHQATPSSIARSGGRVVRDETGNCVYRAPAYFRNKNMGVAHFNPYAVFAKTAHKNMTAIDFTGSNNDVAGGYKYGQQNSKFYPPLLDDGGLAKFLNVDLTKNLLAYTGASSENPTTATERTATAVGKYMTEPAYTESNAKYRTVAYQTDEYIHGHWIENGTATRDHFLVDKQDFNAPISYSFSQEEGKETRMWYQRQPEPDEYVDLKKGWQAISLPFTAELVTTQDKGEITHFYKAVEDDKNERIGHEYWLRECTAITTNTGDATIANATFECPASQTGDEDGDEDKEVNNTFLWDYYYKGLRHEQKDYNNDTYQEYYRTSRQYSNYPLLANGTPYLLGLPGMTYYEFDLSGQFEATTTAEGKKPQKLDPQIITFASVLGTTIGVSDDETTGAAYSGHTFKANYLNEEFAAGGNYYTLKADNGNNASSFDKVPATGDVTKVYAFRPYFTTAAGSSTRTIVFGDEPVVTKKVEEHGDPTEGELNGGLNVWTKKDKIYVQSSLSFTEDLRIVTPAGITVATFTVKPGQTVEVQADFSGMYIVHTLDGKYTKKVTVKRE